MTYHAAVAYTPGCCGVRQILGMLPYPPDEDDFGDGAFDSTCSGETWEQVLTSILDSVEPGLLVQVWFKKARDYEGKVYGEYDANELRLLVQGLEGVIHLGEHVNPNTNNLIDGYQWVNQ